MKEGVIKRRWNLYFYYLTLPIFLILIVINYFAINIKVEALNIPLMISVVSFLFGFLTNINFSMLLKRVHSLREALSKETAKIVGIYLLSKKLGKSFHEKIGKHVDDYAKVTLRNYRNYKEGRAQVYAMYEDIDDMEIKEDYQKTIAGSFLGQLNGLEEAREELEYLTSSRMEISLKLANYILGFLLIILLFLNRGDTFTNIIFIILSTVIVFIFLITEDYDDLRIEDYTANISNAEQIFDLIEKDRYYPQEILGRVKLEKGKNYRIGIWDSKNKKETIFELKHGQISKKEGKK